LHGHNPPPEFHPVYGFLPNSFPRELLPRVSHLFSDADKASTRWFRPPFVLRPWVGSSFTKTSAKIPRAGFVGSFEGCPLTPFLLLPPGSYFCFQMDPSSIGRALLLQFFLTGCHCFAVFSEEVLRWCCAMVFTPLGPRFCLSSFFFVYPL